MSFHTVAKIMVDHGLVPESSPPPRPDQAGQPARSRPILVAIASSLPSPRPTVVRDLTMTDEGTFYSPRDRTILPRLLGYATSTSRRRAPGCRTLHDPEGRIDIGRITNHRESIPTSTTTATTAAAVDGVLGEQTYLRKINARLPIARDRYPITYTIA